MFMEVDPKSARLMVELITFQKQGVQRWYVVGIMLYENGAKKIYLL